jgi:hypothetical protein
MPAAAADDMNDEQCICVVAGELGDGVSLHLTPSASTFFNLLSLLGPQASGLDSCCGVKLFLME